MSVSDSERLIEIRGLAQRYIDASDDDLYCTEEEWDAINAWDDACIGAGHIVDYINRIETLQAQLEQVLKMCRDETKKPAYTDADNLAWAIIELQEKDNAT